MKRYNVVIDLDVMGEDADGEWIRYSDHVEAMKRIAVEGARDGVADNALGYATRLAESLWSKYYKADAPEWKALDTAMGVLTQIDNMVSGMTRVAAPAPTESREAWAVELIQAAVGIMTPEQVGQWAGVRAFLETSAPSAAPAAPAKPVAWVRYCSDGGIEGPILDSDSRICDTRRSFWTPLYAAQPPAAAEAHKDAERLNWLIGHIWIDEIDALPPIPFVNSIEDHLKNVRDAIDSAMERASKEGNGNG